MNDQDYFNYCITLFTAFSAELTTRTMDLGHTDSLRELAHSFQELTDNHAALREQGPGLVERLFTTYPDFAPLFPRDLLWFLGGECLHFMPDEEIAVFQQLDDLRLDSLEQEQAFDYQETRAKLLKLQ